MSVKGSKSLKSEKGGNTLPLRTLHTIHPFRTSTSARRRGSVLLLVIVLLLVLGVLGLAYLSTTRADRQTSAQDVANTEIDSITNGVRQMAIGQIVNSLFALNNYAQPATTTTYTGTYQSQFRGTIPEYSVATPGVPIIPPAVGTTPGTTPALGILPFNNFDVPLYSLSTQEVNAQVLGDTWLADRIPQPQNPATPESLTNPPVWGAITAPLFGGNFESPLPPVTETTQSIFAGYSFATNIPGPFIYTATQQMAPTIVGQPGTTLEYPAFTVPQVTSGNNGTQTNVTVVAGDADGDGIADCGLVRLPGQYTDGLTYYAGVRIVDNNAAVNLNTAWDDQYDYGPTGGGLQPVAAGSQYPPSPFTTAVGLRQLLLGYSASAPTTDPLAGAPTYLTNFRLGGDSAATPNPMLTPLDDNGQTQRTDFSYLTLDDALAHQLGRRLSNPGYFYDPNSVAPNPPVFRAGVMGDADAESLAYHFGLLDPTEYPTMLSGNLPLPMTTADEFLYSIFLTTPQLYAPNMNPITANGSPAISIRVSHNPPGFNIAPGWKSYPYPPFSPAPAVLPPTKKDAFTVVNAWYDTSFQQLTLSSAVPVATNPRPFLVTRNGVSNAAPVHSATVMSSINSYPTVVNAAMAPYGDRGRWQTGVLYYTGDCVTYAGIQNVSQTPPGDTFSGVYFAMGPSGPGTTAGNAAPTDLGIPQDANWNRAVYWTSAATYQKGQYVFVDNNSQGVSVPYQYQFYKALQVVAANQAPSASNAITSFNPSPLTQMWQVWTPPASAMAQKANINTALFPELFRAFWNVMVTTSSTGVLTNPYGTNSIDPSTIYTGEQFNPVTFAPLPTGSAGMQNSLGMFRSPVRDNANPTSAANMIFDSTQVVQLRAAIAAVNAETLRNATQSVIARQIPLTLSIKNKTPTATPVNAIVYGNQPQPFIVQVYVQTDTKDVPTGANGVNTQGYIAIELYNPTNAAINLIPQGPPPPKGNGLATGDAAWQIVTINRSGSQTGGLTLTPLASNSFQQNAQGTNSCIIQPGGFLVVENYNAANPAAGTAVYRPNSAGTFSNVTTANSFYVSDLANVIGTEMVLMRRRSSSGQPSSGTDGTYTWSDTLANVKDYVPVDSFDFSNLTQPSANETTANEWYYDRATAQAEYVYPGRYDGSQNANPRQQGTMTTAPFNVPGTDPGFIVSPVWAKPNSSATYPTIFNIQLTNANGNWAGLNKPSSTTGNKFPFGGFARNGDMLEVPFIGAYEIRDAATGAIYEINTPSMDAAFADDTDTSDDSVPVPPPTNPLPTVEQVGRFCPLIPAQANAIYSDFNRTGTGQRYGWAQSLFDYLTVQDPRDDYFPEADPSVYPPGGTAAQAPTPVTNSNTAIIPNTDAENTETVQGLVNINTAPVQVLESLPLALRTDGTVDLTETQALAQAIVNYRNGGNTVAAKAYAVNGAPGPFTSIFDLNNVQVTAGNTFQNAGGDVTFNGGTPPPGTTTAQGNLTPSSGIQNQFDEQYLQINRLSNLITTRSDSFTVYIVIEGWQNAGTANAALVTTRRTAFIVDRSTVTPQSRTVRIVNIPND